MAQVQVLRCDGPTCFSHVEDRDGAPVQPYEWMELRQAGCYAVHFCSKGCLAEWAATEAKHAAKDSDEAGRWHTIAASSAATRGGIELPPSTGEVAVEAGNPITTNLDGPQYWRPSDATVWPQNVAATNCIPATSGIDFTKPVGCWPIK